MIFYTCNFTDATEGNPYNCIYKNEAYAAICSDATPTALACVVYEPVLKDGKLSFNLIATKTYNNPMCSLSYTEELQAEFSENNVMVMQIGDESTSLVEILGKAGFTHLRCGIFENITLYEGSSVTVTGDNQNAVIAPAGTGLSKITFTCYTKGCAYHGDAGTEDDPIKATLYIYVAEKPTIKATTNSITVTDNTTSPAVSTYRIGLLNKGIVEDKTTTFTSLNELSEYDVIQELKLKINDNEYTGYYHNYIYTVPEEVVNSTYSASLTLNENIDINFKMGNFGEDFSVDKLSVTVDGKAVKLSYADGVVTAILKFVSPEKMSEYLHIVVTYDGATVKDFTYSVKSYCNAVFNAQGYGAESKLGKLCTALLNYGKYAQDYANGNTASTLNAGHEIDFTKYNLEDITNSVVKGTTGKASLSLDSTIKLNYYVKTDKELTNEDTETQNFFVLNGKNEQIDPKRVTITDNGNGNYLVSIDLYASQLSTSYTLKLKDVDTSKFCITYGVYNYCEDAQSQTDEAFTDTLKTLCKAIHNYSVAVDAYIESTESTK